MHSTSSASRWLETTSSVKFLSSARLLLVFLLLGAYVLPTTYAIKFELPTSRHPIPKCIWNSAREHNLIIVTANVGSGPNQRVDIEVVDDSHHRNVYLSKRGISGETRLAITSHADGDVGVCFRNTVDANTPNLELTKASRIIDLDVDIGADAVDYNAIASQESLSALETEMRKLEGVVKEVVDDMAYLKRRESRFRDTN
ncbi:vesicle coat component, partial [Tulasnella sp. 403]